MQVMFLYRMHLAPISILAIGFAVLVYLPGWAHAGAAEDGQRLYKLGRYDDALVTWREGAETGNPQSAYKLALAYEDGIVIPKNFKESRKWFRIAADWGHPAAQFEIGSIYDFGVGVPVETRIAADWYIRAARQGYDPAEYNLATLYETGTGVPQDGIEAYKLFLLVSEGSFAELAIKGMERLRFQLDPIQLAEAERRAARFSPQQEAQ